MVSAVAVSAALVLAYAALGGGSYAPASVADPCAQRAWRAPDGLQEAIEQIALSTADGAACELGVTREDLVLALGSESDLDRFAADNGVSRRQAENAIRDGLVRAIDDAEDANAISLAPPASCVGSRPVSRSDSSSTSSGVLPAYYRPDPRRRPVSTPPLRRMSSLVASVAAAARAGEALPRSSAATA